MKNLLLGEFFLLLNLSLTVPLALSAQPVQKHFEIIDSFDGLSQNSVNCIFQDSFGFMWFGTEYGLSSFDGYQFTNYTPSPADSHSIGGNNISDIIEDVEHNLWIATGNFLSLLTNSNRQQGIFNTFPCPAIVDLEMDPTAQNRQLWIATKNGLYHFSANTKTFKTPLWFEEIFGSKVPLSLSAIHLDKKGNLWLGTNSKGLYLITWDVSGQAKARHFSSISTYNNGQNFYAITSIYDDSSGNIWVSSNGGGIFRLSGAGNSTYTIAFSGSEVNPSDEINAEVMTNSIVEDRAGKIWFSSLNGLMVYNPNTGETRWTNYSRKLNLPSTKTLSLFIDREGLIWAGTQDFGLFKIQNDKPNFRFVPVQWENPVLKKLPNNDVWKISRINQENEYWLGTDHGIFQFARLPGGHYSKVREIPILDHTGKPFELLQVRDIRKLSEHELLLGTIGLGLISLNLQTGRYKEIRRWSKNYEEIPGSSVYAMEAIGNQFWLALNDGYLTSFNWVSGQLEQFEDLFLPAKHRFFTCLKPSQIFSNTIWLGEWNFGLMAFNTASGEFSFPVGKPDSLEWTNTRTVTAIIEKDSILWIGTYGQGLWKTHLKPAMRNRQVDDQLPVMTYRQGNSHDIIFSLLPDKLGRLWLGTEKGLSRFDPGKEIFTNYTKSDGLLSEEFNLGATLDDDGRFLFGTTGGFYDFEPVTDIPDTEPRLHFTSFNRFGKPDRTVDLNQLSVLKLPHTVDFFSIGFSALSFKNPAKNLYIYTLEGYDSHWSNPTSTNEAVFHNLRPGRYSFRVRAANADGLWTKEAKSVNIIINRPFWKTAWFYLLNFAGFAFVLIAGHFILLNRAIRIREEVQARLARNFHDDTGGYLASIQSISYKLSAGHRIEQRQLLKQISCQSEKLAGAFRDLLFELNPSKSSLMSLIVYLSDYADQIFEQTGIAFSINGLDDSFEYLNLDQQWKATLLRILKEGINNILKHCPDRVNVTLGIQVVQRRLILELTDDGPGFHSINQHLGNGLKNMKTRAAELKADLDIISKPGQGTKIKFDGKLPAWSVAAGLKQFYFKS